MANCATEFKNAVTTVDSCPQDKDIVFFITPTGYVGRLWSKLISCITAAVLLLIAAPDDIDVTIDLGWDGRNYYDYPALAGKRFRLYRNGSLLNKTQYRPMDTGGWKLLLTGDILEEGQIFTITQY